jgi:hypothetical protein
MAGGVIIPYATKIFNQILKNKTIPDIFKTGILTPVLKKLKDATQMDNYRGITVTPVITKLFEYVLFPKLSHSFKQSTLQFGFTEGGSMLLSALLISESKAECKLLTADLLFLITVDSQKAFDVVNHIIMLDTMYETGVHPTLWTIIKDFYDGLT